MFDIDLHFGISCTCMSQCVYLVDIQHFVGNSFHKSDREVSSDQDGDGKLSFEEFKAMDPKIAEILEEHGESPANEICGNIQNH